MSKPKYCFVLSHFPKALAGVNSVAEFGNDKYSSPHWKDRLKKEDYLSFLEDRKESLNRHLVSYLGGEELDPESGRPHMWHVTWNALVISELEIEMKKEENERKKS